MRGWIVGSMAWVLAGCATAPDCPEPPATEEHAVVDAKPAAAVETAATVEPAVVIFVRHAEKASDGTADPPLTERGQRRAACLARLLAPFEPDQLITSTYQRTRATLAPLAEAQGLRPREIDAADGQAWASALGALPPGSRVVVAGHSNTIPAWVGGLGVALSGLDAEGNIPHDDYDRLITVVLDEQGRASASTTIAYCTEG